MCAIPLRGCWIWTWATLIVCGGLLGWQDEIGLAQEGRDWQPEQRTVSDAQTGLVRVETTVTNRTTHAIPLPSVRVLERAWDARAGLEGGRYQPLAYRTEQWYGSTFWTGPNWTRVGKNWHHPGENTPSVRRFEVPRDGRITITGRVFKLHQSGDGIRAIIRHNGRDVWQQEIDGADGQGVDPQLSLDVKRGDALRFVVHKRGQIFCDTTGWDPVIAYPDGERFQPSTVFDQQRQGVGGWWYELEQDRAAHEGVPHVFAFARDAALLMLPVRSDQPVELNDSIAQPLFVVADGRDGAGTVIAVPDGKSWALRVSLDAQGKLQTVLYDRALEGQSLAAGASLALPAVWEGRYEGSWLKGMTLLQKSGKSEKGSGLDSLPLDLWAMIQADWRRQDQIVETAESYANAAWRQLQAARKLLEDLRADHGAAFLQEESRQLAELAAMAALVGLEDPAHPTKADPTKAQAGVAANRALWLKIRRLKRQLALANPLLDFGPLLVCKRVPPSWSHLVAQYYGWRQRPGGGLYVVERPGRSLAVRDILRGQLPPGNILEPRLSYDARRIVFSFVPCSADVPDPVKLPVNERGKEDRYFHIYEVQVDGSGLRQLTEGNYDDMMPEYLPDGDIVFCSTRRKGYSRCFGPEYSYRWHSYTLHRMGPDGQNIRTLSFNDVSEWFPAVTNSGLILHARWDYIDRDAVTHQNLWALRPDGTNPIAVWGNATPKPHCSFQAKPIPNSDKLVFIAAAHHAITAGPVCVVDPTVDVTSLAAVQRITPGPFPEAESNDIPEYFESPWPLSEKYFLVAYSAERLRFQGEHPSNPNPDNALGVYVLDVAGNRELLYRDPDISSANPTPLRPRPRPPILAPTATVDAEPTGEMIVTDVYQGLGDVPRGSIKELRVIQVFPKSTWIANQPMLGVAGEENGRAILGTVPVEADGSARFTVPAGKPLLFQALDADGLAYQTMRSLTYVQPGERTACIGCHEHRMSAPPASATLALRRPPSVIAPGELGGRPFSFVEMVQPVLDRHCVRCHGGEKTEGEVDLTGAPAQGFTRSYRALCFGRPDGPKPTAAWVPCFAQRNQIQVTTPGGAIGARGSRLLKLLRDGAGHYEVRLNREELQRLGAWIDCNAVFYGVYEPDEQAKQLRGERVAMPDLQ